MTDRVGQQLGNYRMVSLLGRGSFAEVYLGEHVYLHTQAAIKVMFTQLSKDDMALFLAEARTLAQLIHPNIVRVLDFGVDRSTPFLVLDYAPNGTLRDRHPSRTQLPLRTIVLYMKQLAGALQYAHVARLIHRDIKPENMLVGRNSEVLLSDFGLAVMIRDSFSLATQGVAGSAGYIAPEQIQGKPRRASDQYSLGIVAYEWLTGKRPFEGSTFFEVALKHLSTPPPPLREKIPAIPPAVEQVVFKALEKEPQNRFASVQEFAAALEAACGAEPKVFSAGPTGTHPRPQKTKEQCLEEGNRYCAQKQYETALAAYEQALQFDPFYATAYYNKGNALDDLKRYEEALLAYNRAIQLNPDYALAYNNKGVTLSTLKRYEEAVEMFDRATQLNPNLALAYSNKGNALNELRRYQDALAACNDAIQLNPNYISAYRNKGIALEGLGRTAEAQKAYQKARELTSGV